MKCEIKHRLNGSVLFSLECESLKICLEAAVKAGADLAGAPEAGQGARKRALAPPKPAGPGARTRTGGVESLGGRKNNPTKIVGNTPRPSRSRSGGLTSIGVRGGANQGRAATGSRDLREGNGSTAAQSIH
jgi:hypothetical protein